MPKLWRAKLMISQSSTLVSSNKWGNKRINGWANAKIMRDNFSKNLKVLAKCKKELRSTSVKCRKHSKYMKLISSWVATIYN